MAEFKANPRAEKQSRARKEAKPSASRGRNLSAVAESARTRTADVRARDVMDGGTDLRDVRSAGSPDPSRQPVSRVEWVDPATLRANDYNPNRVFTPEMELLKLSILEHGWTQPVVARRDGEIIDGFHRWTLASTDAEVRAASGGLCPVVFLEGGSVESQKLATIRHNRARGQHGILKMGEIVRSLAASGWDAGRIGESLQMEEEEVARLMDIRPSPAQAGRDHFGKGWAPTYQQGTQNDKRRSD